MQVSIPGTPARSRPTSRPSSRATSPSRRSNLRGLSALSGVTKSSRDPLRVLPTDVSQKIFGQLSIRELAKCARVSRRWSKSQTLNYGASHMIISLRGVDRSTDGDVMCVQCGSSITAKTTSTTTPSHPENGPSANPKKTGAPPTSGPSTRANALPSPTPVPYHPLCRRDTRRRGKLGRRGGRRRRMGCRGRVRLR